MCARVEVPISHKPLDPKRFDIKSILRDPVLRRELAARSLRFIQAVEGRDISMEEALDVVDRVSPPSAGPLAPSAIEQ